MCCCRPRPGARRTAPSPTRSGASRGSAPFLPLPGEAKPDWWIVSRGGAAHGLRRGASPIARPPTCFASTPRLSAFENDGARDFDLGGARRHSRTTTSTRSRRCSGRCARARRRAESALLRRRRLLHARPQGALRRAASRRRCADATSDAFPFRLNTGRIRDQWHTMTRTGHERRGSATHLPEPFVEVHPRRRRASRASPTAAWRGSRRRMAPACSRSWSATASSAGSLFVPIHWSDETASCARVGELVAPRTDPYLRPARGEGDAGRDRAGRAAAIAASPCRAAPLALPAGTWWARVAVADGADIPTGDQRGPDGLARLRAPGCSPARRRWQSMLDAARLYRAAAFVDGELDGCLCVGPRRRTAAMGHRGPVRRRRRAAGGACLDRRRSARPSR